MKTETEKYSVECFFDGEWQGFGSHAEYIDAQAQIEREIQWDKARQLNYRYQIVRVTTTREVVK